MPSQSHRDDLPAHYYRSGFLRQVAAAIIRSAARRQHATPRRPSIRAEVIVGEPQRPATTDRPTSAPRQEPRALPASPQHPRVQAEATEQTRERVRRRAERRDQ